MPPHPPSETCELSATVMENGGLTTSSDSFLGEKTDGVVRKLSALNPWQAVVAGAKVGRMEGSKHARRAVSLLAMESKRLFLVLDASAGDFIEEDREIY